MLTTEAPAGYLPDSPLLREAARRARRLGRPILVSLTRRVDPRDPLAEFARAAQVSAERAVWLRPEAGESLVCVGAAHVLAPRGPERYARVARAWQAVLEDALVEDPDGLAWTGPLLLGGFAFDPLRQPSPHWSGFSEARLVLPATTLAQRSGRAWQTTNVLVPPEDAADAADAADKPVGRQRRERVHPLRVTPFHGAEELPPDGPAWQSLVEMLASGIRDGSLGVEKVVLARADYRLADTPRDPARCLDRLANSYPTCTVFAVAQADACFLGATPERLAQAHQGTAWTMALAGSMGRGATPDEDRRLGERLLASQKDRAEHAVVVRALRAALTPDVCASLAVDPEPRLVRLPNVQHLLTSVRAQLAAGKSVLDLVGRLHPSPAVGGFPQARALELIRQREGLDRGWYGGPLGWLNAAGDGEFVVSIRSGLLRGREAWLYAGCGIVADSDPAAEYAESEWKMAPMRAALDLAA